MNVYETLCDKYLESNLFISGNGAEGNLSKSLAAR
jgi:hypothetical protein